MSHEYFKNLDKELLNLRRYCHPDAPNEFIVISENAIPVKNDTKKVESMVVRGRYVEIIYDPQLSGKLEVIIKRAPKNTLLTYSEVYEILQEITRKAGFDIKWKRPFPRGSC
jgi:hypothetical protein